MKEATSELDMHGVWVGYKPTGAGICPTGAGICLVPNCVTRTTQRRTTRKGRQKIDPKTPQLLRQRSGHRPDLDMVVVPSAVDEYTGQAAHRR